jgi:hypothetical protein
MKWTWRFVLPVILGIAAAGINYAVLNLRLSPRMYVQAASKLKRGTDIFDTDNVKKVELAVDIPAALPWEDHKVLFSLPVSRDLQPGDLILRSDIVLPEEELKLNPGEVALNISLEGVRFESNLLQVGRKVGFAISEVTVPRDGGPRTVTVGERFDAVGPFRIVSVGARISRQPLADSVQDRSGVTTVSVATAQLADGRVDDKASRLLQANRDKTIVALVLYADESPPATALEKSTGSSSSKSQGGP